LVSNQTAALNLKLKFNLTNQNIALILYVIDAKTKVQYVIEALTQISREKLKFFSGRKPGGRNVH
jgi:hypothetical protein